MEVGWLAREAEPVEVVEAMEGGSRSLAWLASHPALGEQTAMVLQSEAVMRGSGQVPSD